MLEKLIDTSGDVTTVNDILSGLHLSAVILNTAPSDSKGCILTFK